MRDDRLGQTQPPPIRFAGAGLPITRRCDACQQNGKASLGGKVKRGGMWWCAGCVARATE